MLIRFILVAIFLVVILFVCDILIPKFKIRYHIRKDLKEMKKRNKAFTKKNKKLENK